MHLEPEFNKTYGPYIRNWAPAHKILAPESYTPQMIEMLQSPLLVGSNACRGQPL
jgi:hypothetical protein